MMSASMQGALAFQRGLGCVHSLSHSLGGIDPRLHHGTLDVAVNAALNSGFFSTGQRCTASPRLIVTEGIHDRFIAAMAEKMKALKVDDAHKKGTDIGPAVDDKQLAQNLQYVAIATAEGAKLLAGGEAIERNGDGAPGYYMRPALFAETTAAMRINREEVFGPVVSVIRAKNYEEALALANDSEFGLSAGVATTSLKYATHFKRHVQAGMVMVNLPTVGVDYHVPFGGRKGSSYGPRAGPLCRGVLHDGQDGVYGRLVCAARSSGTKAPFASDKAPLVFAPVDSPASRASSSRSASSRSASLANTARVASRVSGPTRRLSRATGSSPSRWPDHSGIREPDVADRSGRSGLTSTYSAAYSGDAQS
jgi:delta 1-pyrroline-5-carboxylate dehydrogenase